MGTHIRAGLELRFDEFEKVLVVHARAVVHVTIDFVDVVKVTMRDDLEERKKKKKGSRAKGFESQKRRNDKDQVVFGLRIKGIKLSGQLSPWLS